MADVELLYARDPRAVRTILESLPDWFGDPAAIESYTEAAADERYRSLLATRAGRTVAIALVARHFPESAELHLIAVAPTERGSGIGRALIDRLAADLRADGCRLLSVHTVGPSFPHDGYATTRAFYHRTGFIPLEEHHGLDWDGPTLILARILA